MDFTSRLGLNKPNPDPVTGDAVDVTKLNDNADKIDDTISFTICTSTLRPAAPFPGQAILETDTGRAYVWGGSAWLPLAIGAKAQIDTNLGIGTAPDASAARRLKTFWAGTMGGTSQVQFVQSGAATGSRALGILAGGEANERYTLDFDGKMQWGPGTAGGDVTLGRSAAGTIDVGGALTVGGVTPGNSQVDVFTASGTWTKPAGAKRVRVRLVGGGGGGGGAGLAGTGAHSKGGGGGGGAYAEKWFDASALTATVAITRGSGGVGGTGGGGATGGTTSFGAFLSASGGGGGFNNNNNTSHWGVQGGNGGNTFTGSPDIAAGGGGGAAGWGAGTLAMGGAGGSSALGGGGAGNSSGATNGTFQGNDAVGYGGGGGGSGVNGTGSPASTGGNGSNGIVIVETYF